MAKADWTNQIWYAFLDPTGALDSNLPNNTNLPGPSASGPVCKVMAPISKEWSDILKYEIGSNPQSLWSQTDYRVYLDYAWPSGRGSVPRPTQDDEYHIFVRTTGSSFLSDSYKFTDGYKTTIKRGTDANNDATVTLYRRVSSSDTSLVTTTMGVINSTILAQGVKNTASVTVQGGSQDVALTVYLNGIQVLTYTDTDASSFTSGAPGMGVTSGGNVYGGAVYIDNFRVRLLTVPQGTETWLPTKLSNLSLWYKASDGVTKDYQNAVLDIVDVSGNQNDGQQLTVAERPVWTANQLNAFPILDFSNAMSLTAADSVSLDMTDAVTAFVVMKIDSFGTYDTSQYYRGPFCAKGANYKMGVINTASTGTAGEIYFEDGTTEFQSSNASISTSATEYTQICIVSQTAAQVAGTFYKDGTAIGACAGTPSTNGANTDVLAIGRDAANYFDGQIAEWIIFKEQMIAANREKVEGYIAWRYDLVSELPNDHPYKLAPPT